MINKGSSFRIGHYYCNVLDFNKGIWYNCDSDKIYYIRDLPEGIYDRENYKIKDTGKKSTKF